VAREHFEPFLLSQWPEVPESLIGQNPRPLLWYNSESRIYFPRQSIVTLVIESSEWTAQACGWLSIVGSTPATSHTSLSGIKLPSNSAAFRISGEDFLKLKDFPAGHTGWRLKG
jgi:hypothetical protein